MIRGELWWADFGIPFGSEAGYRRPVLIVQNVG
jgi:mRNA interferase MazF